MATWVPDDDGNRQLMAGLAAGLDEFAGYVAARVRQVEGGLERYTFGGNVHYRDTITHTTWLNGEIVGSGHEVRGGARSGHGPIHSRVYTASFLGHMLEVTGASPHVVGGRHHPGFAHRPHFVPGLLSAASQAGVKMRGKRIVGRSEADRLAGKTRAP